jgi:hypothetical protein
MSDRIETYIYESPDGGGTIYRRTAGSVDRELIREGPLRKQMLRNQLWRDIFQAAESDPVLKDMLDRVEVYYTLKDSP